MIKYIGSKRVLIPQIVELVSALPGLRSAVDLFSGTSRVGHALKGRGIAVQSNDHNAYAATLARCYVQADREEVLDEVRARVEALQALPGVRGYFTEVFCEQSRYLQVPNGERVDAMRAQIAAWSLSPEVEAVLLTALMEAADRVDSTTGVQMAYLKQWSPRSHGPITLRVPDLLPRAAAGKGRAWQLDAVEAARRLTGDLAYVDPPYNQHKYLGNYHVWETLVRWDAPAHYGVACKRVDVRDQVSVFNSKPRMREAMRQVIEALDVRYLLVSFSDEGYLGREELVEMLATRGRVRIVERAMKRYVGAQIGIYNPQGARVGEVGHLGNKEFLFLVTPPDLHLEVPGLVDAG
jgi:adenine-specific DNA-methyltransferase